jgi:copper chaperone CopZ
MMRVVLLTLPFIISLGYLNAQDLWRVQIGVNGLTCSACTRSVEMSLRRLDFVDSVQMSLENTEGIVTSKVGTQVDFNRLAKAVVDAGFSVRFLRVTVDLENIPINADGCFMIGENSFQWISYESNQSKPSVLRFVDASFLPGKESNRWKKKFKTNTCFPGKPLFHVTNDLE